jgi:hypothetical protein
MKGGVASHTAPCVLAAIIVLIVLIIAVLVHRRFSKSGGTDGFKTSHAASLRLREAVALLNGDLSCISRIADSINTHENRIKEKLGAADMDTAFKGAHRILQGARLGMVEIVRSIKRLKSTISSMDHSYNNVLSLYQGLRDSDKALWGAADAIDLAGDRMQYFTPAADIKPDHKDLSLSIQQDLASVASQLHQLSSCLYGLVRSVHTLGSSLRLE